MVDADGSASCTAADHFDERVLELLERGAGAGYLQLSEVEALIEEAGLDADDEAALLDEIAAREIPLHDDGGREHLGTTYVNGYLAETTTDALQLFFRDMSRFPLLTAAQEVALAKRIEQGDADAKQELINANLRLVVSIAKRYQRRGDGAARSDPGGCARPDPRRGEVRLAQGLQVLDLRDLVDSPGDPAWNREPVAHDPPAGGRRRPRAADRATYRRTTRRASGARPAMPNRECTRDCTPGKISRVRHAARAVASLDQPLGEGEGASLAEIVADTGTGEPVEEIHLSLRRDALHRALAALPGEERRALELRYGLDGDEAPVTLVEAGRRLGISPDRVRQLETEALERLALEREIAALAEEAA